MAISIIEQPLKHAPGFGRNVFKISVSPYTTRLKLTLLQDDNPIGVQFSPPFNNISNFSLSGKFASFSLSGLYTSRLGGWTYPLDNGQLNTDPHRVVLREIFEEEGPASPDDTSTGRTVYKAMDTGYGTLWDTSTGNSSFALWRGDDIRRMTKQGQKIPISLWRGDPSSNTPINIDGVLLANLSGDGRHFSIFTSEISGSGVRVLSLSETEKVSLYMRSSGHVVYWIGPYGGWEWFVFDDRETRAVSDREEWIGRTEIEGERTPRSYPLRYTEEIALRSGPLNRQWKEHLKTIFYSPVILDEEGNRLRLITNDFVYEEREFTDIRMDFKYMENEFLYR